ncbi:MAG: hypothetical protein INR68_12845 [Methylobacterium mesophilicum]|nr:hypothetical protein [Methylobacterium mesophilicum]
MSRSAASLPLLLALGLIAGCQSGASNTSYSTASTGPVTAGGRTGIAATGTDTAAVVSATGDPTAGTTSTSSGTPATGY